VRCDALGLDGGVGEYGSVVWDHKRGRAETLVEVGEGSALQRVREAAAAMPGVHVDDRYRNSVRCRRLVGDSLLALEKEDADRLARIGGPQVKLVQGYLQTDLHAASVDKGIGLKAALDLSGVKGWVVAVGDTASDLPMLKLADRAYVPANAGSDVRSVGIRISRPRQVGLLEGVLHEHRAIWPSGTSRKLDPLLRLFALRDAPRWRRAMSGAER
jgi:hypothetical protein